MINYLLAERRGLSAEDIADLEVLHEIMDELEFRWSEEHMPTKASRKHLKRVVEGIEYMMQDKWRFPRDRTMHGHWRRFEGLYRKRRVIR